MRDLVIQGPKYAHIIPGRCGPAPALLVPLRWQLGCTSSRWITPLQVLYACLQSPHWLLVGPPWAKDIIAKAQRLVICFRASHGAKA